MISESKAIQRESFFSWRVQYRYWTNGTNYVYEIGLVYLFLSMEFWNWLLTADSSTICTYIHRLTPNPNGEDFLSGYTDVCVFARSFTSHSICFFSSRARWRTNERCDVLVTHLPICLHNHQTQLWIPISPINLDLINNIMYQQIEFGTDKKCLRLPAGVSSSWKFSTITVICLVGTYSIMFLLQPYVEVIYIIMPLALIFISAEISGN